MGQRGEGDERPERRIFRSTMHLTNRNKCSCECGTFEAQLTADCQDLINVDIQVPAETLMFPLYGIGVGE